MSTAFISYRQVNDAQRQRVRMFAERLRGCDIEVILDQFFLEVNPAGPNDGWDKWSSDCALRTPYVLIVGTQAWFECFEKSQSPGTGLGAACEADDLRHRIYEAGGVIESIRVVLFDDAEVVHIPSKLKRYHCFHSDRDFASIVRWLGGTVSSATAASASAVRTSIRHNLPSLPSFFGREEELRKVADALDPENRTWGVLIDGPGGMGKTSLAVRAAYSVSSVTFERIVFVSLKSRELDDDGERDLSGFTISGLAELFNELARELGLPDISKAADNQRPRMLLDALRDTRTLLILDNLESLLKSERDIIFTIVKRLPFGCKAVLTSRRRIGSAGEELVLGKLSEQAALAILEKLAESNAVLAGTSDAERLVLYHLTDGKPLLLRWTAGQIGRGNCLTFDDAIQFLCSCPDGNDPLEFIFGDLIADLSHVEAAVLSVLLHFTLPATAASASKIANCSEADADRVLRSLANRSLVIWSANPKSITVVPLVGDYLRKKKPESVIVAGEHLKQYVHALVVDCQLEHLRFPILEDEWPIIAASLKLFLEGPHELLVKLADSISDFLIFAGHWDEKVALSREVEAGSLAAGDFRDAGWGAYGLGMIHYYRHEPENVIACAGRAETHWSQVPDSTRERAIAISLRGLGHVLTKNYQAAIAANREMVDMLLREVKRDDQDIANALNTLGAVEHSAGDFEASERSYREALQIATAAKAHAIIAVTTGNLAQISLDRRDWFEAETLARESLLLSQGVGHLDLIASDCRRLARALLEQGKKTEARLHARRAVEILTKLGSPDVAAVSAILVKTED